MAVFCLMIIIILADIYILFGLGTILSYIFYTLKHPYEMGTNIPIFTSEETWTQRLIYPNFYS